jgi:hypothetical protein
MGIPMGNEKLKIDFYYAISCLGCEVAVLGVNEKIFLKKGIVL